MDSFVLELKAAWVGNRRRKFYQSTRGIMTPEERIALENDFDRKLAEHDRRVAERAWVLCDTALTEHFHAHEGAMKPRTVVNWPDNPHRKEQDDE